MSDSPNADGGSPGGTGRRHGDRTRDTGTDGSGVLRRTFVGALGTLGVLGTLPGTGSADDAADAAGAADAGSTAGDAPGSSRKIRRRVRAELTNRTDYSRQQLLFDADISAHESNPRLSDRAVVGKFGKSLPHDDRTGTATVPAYDGLVTACETGSGYGSIPQAFEGADADRVRRSTSIDPAPAAGGTFDSRPLVQPESAWTYTTEGASTAQLRIATPPRFDSAEAGAEMVELYWRALTRDVNFRDYDTDERVRAAARELDRLDGYRGPGADGRVSTGNVFRGVVPGATTGPYVSQFLWKDRELGGGTEDQRIEPQVAETTPRDYATDVEDWLKIQKGVAPGLDRNLPGNEYGDERRYLVTGRDLCERVHDDPPFRQLQKAAQVLVFSTNAPLDPGIPYTMKPFAGAGSGERDADAFAAQTTFPFNDFGPLYVEKKVLEASEHGQRAAWHKKWNVHRRCRPEEYGGRVQAHLGSGLVEPAGVDLGSLLPDNLLSSEALARTRREYGSYLLPQAYAEGSPTHPSYPAGHSVVAGAGVTVLKALFDGDYEFPADEKVVPTRDGSDLLTAEETAAMGVRETLTVRGELNKLAANMALGRNRAGIHYRSDGIEGLRLGEAAAIRFLEDQLTLPVGVGGREGRGRGPLGDADPPGVELTLETFDGETVTVSATSGRDFPVRPHEGDPGSGSGDPAAGGDGPGPVSR